MNLEELVKKGLILDSDYFYGGAKRVGSVELDRLVAESICSKSQVELVYVISFIKVDLIDLRKLEVTEEILNEL